MLKYPPSKAIMKYREFPEGVPCEVIYDQIVTTAWPHTRHQQISMKLSSLLYFLLEETKKGIVLRKPCDVYLEEQRSVVQPDIFVILDENKQIIYEDAIYGVPDIIFEILCGNRAYDRIEKKGLYEQAGVKEYFIIDPLDNTVTMFTLNSQHKYELVYELKGKITSAILATSFDL